MGGGAAAAAAAAFLVAWALWALEKGHGAPPAPEETGQPPAAARERRAAQRAERKRSRVAVRG
jgi:hypothetical protein